MIWTTTPPAREGWYWFRSSDDRARVIEVIRSPVNGGLVAFLCDQDWEVGELVRYSDRPQFAGPIDRPAEPPLVLKADPFLSRVIGTAFGPMPAVPIDKVPTGE